jgi:hypothetical protein
VTSKLTKVSVATIQRLKNEFIRDAWYTQCHPLGIAQCYVPTRSPRGEV